MGKNKFDFGWKVEIGGEEYRIRSYVFKPEFQKQMQTISKQLIDHSNRCFACDQTDVGAVAKLKKEYNELSEKLVDLILGEGSFKKIMSGGDTDPYDVTMLLDFLSDEITAFSEHRLNLQARK